VAALSVAGLVVGASACGGGAEARPAAPAGDVVIVEKDYQFVPDQLELEVGQDLTIVVDNQDQRTSHNIHFPTAPGSPRTKLENGPGYQALTIRFDEAGSYPFVCDIHATMRGTVTAR